MDISLYILCPARFCGRCLYLKEMFGQVWVSAIAIRGIFRINPTYLAFTMNPPGSSWRRLPDQSYERPLCTLELAFYWFAAFARTTDMIRCAQIKIVAGKIDEIIGLPDVARAWSNVKQRYPLLGSRLCEHDNGIFLNVSQDRLLTHQKNEISFHGVSSRSEALCLADSMLETEHLSNDLLARIVIARDHSQMDSFYFLFTVSHVVADGVSCMTIIKAFVNELCGISSDRSTLEERLAFCLASEQLNPAARLNKARQRWRTAIAATIASRRMTRFKARNILRFPSTIIVMIIMFVDRVGMDFRRKCLKKHGSLLLERHTEV